MHRKATSVRRSKHRAAKAARPARSIEPASFPRAIIRGGPWTEPTYADSTRGDNVDGEDLAVRRAAVSALGAYNGTVVVVDPSNGRILTMVNQKLALEGGFQPCSTIKVSVALAALSEGTLPPSPLARLGRSVTLTNAIAHSNNAFFAGLGMKLGFDTVSRYAHMFGYGEKAGLNIAGEQPGKFPAAPPRNGGVGMLTSFGEEISQTPLELAALMSALSNGGTLYYLQYPRNHQETEHFVPRVKRHLDIARFIPVVRPGMLGAVEFGTARRASQDTPIAGKTGTCTDGHTHMGWFGSFSENGRPLVVVVMLTGGRPAIGPRAAGIAGEVYKNLAPVENVATGAVATPAALVSTQICCSR